MVRGKLGHGMEDYVVAENRKINGHELGLYVMPSLLYSWFIRTFGQEKFLSFFFHFQPDFWANLK